MTTFGNKIKTKFTKALVVGAVLTFGSISASTSEAAALPIKNVENENAPPISTGQVISRKVDQRFGIMRLEDSIWCNTHDIDKDGQLDTTHVELSLRAVIHDGPGILNLTYIHNEFPAIDNSICEKINKIADSSRMMFGATYGGFDSVLTLHGDRLVEELTIRLHSARTFEPGEAQLTFTMTAKTEKTLN